MKRLMRLLEDVFWPRGFKCLCCCELSHGKLLCADCQKSLDVLKMKAADMENPMFRSAYTYHGTARELVLLLKEQCCAEAAKPLAMQMAEIAKEMRLPPDAVLTWVTMPKRRLMKRGIDHGYTLCQEVSALTGFPVRQLMTRRGKLHTQRGLSRRKRLKNLSGTLICPQPVESPVLLIDDVMTTGATASACIDVLQGAGAEQVYVLTATRVVRE